MYLLLILILTIISKTICSDITATRVQPIIQVYDSDHLFINFSASFEGEIESASAARLRSVQGHDYSIIDNKIENMQHAIKRNLG